MSCGSFCEHELDLTIHALIYVIGALVLSYIFRQHHTGVKSVVELLLKEMKHAAKLSPTSGAINFYGTMMVLVLLFGAEIYNIVSVIGESGAAGAFLKLDKLDMFGPAILLGILLLLSLSYFKRDTD
jgi:hypothetical protein